MSQPHVLEVIAEMKKLQDSTGNMKTFMRKLVTQDYFKHITARASITIKNLDSKYFTHRHILQYGADYIMIEYHTKSVNSLHTYECSKDMDGNDVFDISLITFQSQSDNDGFILGVKKIYM